MRELPIGEVEVRAREMGVEEVKSSEGKEEREEGEEAAQVVERGHGCGDVRLWVRCVKIGNDEKWSDPHLSSSLVRSHCTRLALTLALPRFDLFALQEESCCI